MIHGRMKMKIRFLSETSLDTLTQNIDSYLHFFNESDNHGLLEALESDVGDKPLIESNYLISDSISLDPTLRGGDEVSNIKKLYSELKTLPRSIACDGRIWAGLSIDKFWTYTRKRWGFEGSATSSKVFEHFLFKGQSKKIYTRQAIARLWWIADLTYDARRKDPYEITSFTLKDTDYVVSLLERNFSSNRQIFREFVEAVEVGRREGMVINRVVIRELCKYLNLLGGVYVLDALPEGMIREKIYLQSKKLSGAIG